MADFKVLVLVAALGSAFCVGATLASPSTPASEKRAGQAPLLRSADTTSTKLTTTSTKQTTTTTKQTTETTTAKPIPKRTVAASQKRMMVPPPPPEIPLIGSGDEHIISTLGVPLDYMSKADLLNLQTRLQQSVTKLQRQVDDRNESMTSTRERATQFEQLFREGVVSKRELERARKEFAEMEDGGAELDIRLQDAKTDLQRVNKQLEVVAKKSPPIKEAKKDAKTEAKKSKS